MPYSVVVVTPTPRSSQQDQFRPAYPHAQYKSRFASFECSGIDIGIMAIDFLSLPAEVIHSIFAKVEPVDLARLKRCCRLFNNFIKSDWLIFKEVFLNHFVCELRGSYPALLTLAGRSTLPTPYHRCRRRRTVVAGGFAPVCRGR